MGELISRAFLPTPPNQRLLLEKVACPALLAHGILVARGIQGQYVKGVCRDRERRQVDKVWAMRSYLYGGGTIEF